MFASGLDSQVTLLNVDLNGLNRRAGGYHIHEYPLVANNKKQGEKQNTGTKTNTNTNTNIRQPQQQQQQQNTNIRQQQRNNFEHQQNTNFGGQNTNIGGQNTNIRGQNTNIKEEGANMNTLTCKTTGGHYNPYGESDSWSRLSIY